MMQLNFSLKKAWNDLFLKEQYIIQFLSMAALIVLCLLAGELFKMDGASSIPTFIIGAYFCLIRNNIINGSIPAMAEIFKDPLKFLRAGLGLTFLFVTYALTFFLIGISIFFIGANVLNLPAFSLTIFVLAITLSVFSLLFAFAKLLFSENLCLKDGFNLSKAMISFKRGTKEYLIIFGFYIILYSVILTIIFCTNSFAYNPIDRHVTIALPANTLAMLAIFMLDYFYNHLLAQTYKYSLLKIDVTVI